MLEQNVADPPETRPIARPTIEFDAHRALETAINAHRDGRTSEADRLYKTILANHPNQVVASYNLGLLYNNQGRLQDAVAAYRHAINIRPDYTDAIINLGTASLALGKHEEAVELFRRAIAINPHNALALGNLGKALQDLGRVEEAVAAYREALGHAPDNALVHLNLGGALLEQRAWDKAEAVTRRAISLSPNSALAHANLGTALLNLGRYDDALAACSQAIELRPQGAVVLASLGGAMLELGAWPQAEELCRQAIAADSTLPNAWFNLSHTLKAMNQLDEAVVTVRQAIALRPESAEYHFHLAHVLLLRGDLEEGWAEYEWRWKLPDFAWLSAIHGLFSQPRWTGEDISDKTILIYTEQGLGDIIQFVRYLPLVVQKARRVILAVHPPLLRLLETIEGVTLVSMHLVPLPAFDLHCPLLSLPRVLATRLESIPQPMSYLRADPAERSRWDARIRLKTLRVGLVWAGNPMTRRDRFRSPGFSNIVPLLSVPGVDFVVLQVGPGRNGLDPRQLPPHVLDLGQEVSDLAETAAIMSGLDLMISSCTGPLHLAGALGVPTWAMIPFAPYFPWLLERTDSVWYPTMTLYRQEQPGQDWSGVIGRVAADLATWAQSKARPSRAPLTLDQEIPTQGEAATPELPIPLPDAVGFNELAICRSGLFLFNRNDIYIGASLRKYGEFSSAETALFNILVQPGMTVLDIGANIGVHTVDLSRMVGPAGTVLAFEPQRLVFQSLCANIALNSCANVFTHHTAVGASGGKLLVPSLDPAGSANYGGVSLVGTQQGDLIPIVTIDSLDLCACHIIKLDVEGMETEALQGAAETIQRFRPILYVENDRRERSNELISLIQSFSYRLYWHFPPLYSPGNFRTDPENIFGGTISVNMLCIPAEIPQAALINLREVVSPTDDWRIG